MAQQDVQTTLEKIREKLPDEAQILADYLESIRKKDIAVLGEDEAFKLTDSDGEIRAFHSAVRFKATDGTLIQPVPNGPYVISAQGYEKWAEAAGAVVMNAPTVLVDGQPAQNPHVTRDPNNGRILLVYARAIAFRYSSKGIPMVSDRTTIFDLPSYRLIDLLAKAKKFPQAFRLLPVGMKPNGDNGETWAEYPFDEYTRLWVNTSHDEALQFYGQILNREKKAMEFAQTFAQRNALKHLSGLQKVPGQEKHPIPQWDCKVICWRPTSGNLIKWDMSRYALAATNMERLANGEQDAILLEKGVDYVSDEPEALPEMEDPEDATQGNLRTPDTADPPPEPNDPVWAQLKAIKESVPDIYQKSLDDTGIRHPMTVEAARRVLKRAQEIADSA